MAFSLEKLPFLLAPVSYEVYALNLNLVEEGQTKPKWKKKNADSRTSTTAENFLQTCTLCYETLHMFTILSVFIKKYLLFCCRTCLCIIWAGLSSGYFKYVPVLSDFIKFFSCSTFKLAYVLFGLNYQVGTWHIFQWVNISHFNSELNLPLIILVWNLILVGFDCSVREHASKSFWGYNCTSYLIKYTFGFCLCLSLLTSISYSSYL